MIKPERMSLIKLLFFKEDLNEVSKFLMESGIVEIEKSANFIETKDKFEEINMSKLISDSNNLLKELNDLSKNLDIRRCVPKKLILSPIFNIGEEIGKEFQKLNDKVNSLLEETKFLEEEVNKLQLKSRLFSFIEDIGFSVSQLKALPHIFLSIGSVSLRGLDSLKNFVKTSNVDLKILGYHKNEAIISVFTLKENEEKLKPVLQTVGFNKLELGDEDKSVSDLIEELELFLWEKREKLAEIKKNIKEIGEKESERICYWIWLLEYNLKLFSAMNFFLETKLGYIVTAWIPTKKLGR
jgi:vacuolar-type H+-ATPase subunit I/STV1